MSKSNLSYPYANASGKFDHSKSVSNRVSYGVQHTYTWNPDTVMVQTPSRVLHQFALKLANLRTSEVMSDPDKLKQFRKSISTPNMSNDAIKKLSPTFFRHQLVAYFIREIKQAALQHDAETIHTLMDLANLSEQIKSGEIKPVTNSPKAQALSTFLQ